jgi:hypothetical protein
LGHKGHSGERKKGRKKKKIWKKTEKEGRRKEEQVTFYHYDTGVPNGAERS